jgi:NADPH-dependent ferric siderophore reductase
LPDDAVGKLIAEVKNEAAVPPMPSRSSVELEWVYARDEEHGVGNRLLKAVAALPVPDTLVYAWGGGEMKAMRQIGRLLRKQWGLKTSSISATGYWRHGVSVED